MSATVSPFENPVVLEESAAVWRRALARRAERIERERRENAQPDSEAS